MSEHNQFHREWDSRRNFSKHFWSFCRQRLSRYKNTGSEQKNQRRKGQVVVEYVLLLIIAVSIAGLVLKGCVSRKQDEAGVVIQFWDEMLNVVGADEADEP